MAAVNRSRVVGSAVLALGMGLGSAALLAFTVDSASGQSLTAKSAQSAAPAGKHVYFVQGVPNADVSITVDGTSVGSAVAAKDIVSARLAAGDHSVTFTSDDFTVTSSFTINSRSTDVVIHWPADSDAKPEVTVFKNDVSKVTAGKGRVTVAHTAVVPPADIRVDGDVLFANVANGQFASVVVPAGTYPVDVVPTGQSSDPLLGPVDLPVKANALTRVFAIGAPKNGTDMDAIVQVLPLKTSGSPAPGSVDAGAAGLVATQPGADGTSDGTDPAWAAIALLGGCCAAGGALAVARRRS